MITADRPALIRRSIACYLHQTYPRKELVVLDNGLRSARSALRDVPTNELVYRRIDHPHGLVIGDLRNMALDLACGDFIVPQWDDDDWYHPDRVAMQAEVLRRGYDACALSGTLMHVKDEPYFDRPFIGLLKDGVPPTIMHLRDDSTRYPSLPRAEDTAYLQLWLERSYYLFPPSEAYLYIRSFHRTNTWGVDHFLRRIRNTPRDWVDYYWCRFVRRDPFRHTRFALTHDMLETFARYMEASCNLGLFETRPPVLAQPGERTTNAEQAPAREPEFAAV
jgi:glycosyltransferase involved in cell wall biosynthesis